MSVNPSNSERELLHRIADGDQTAFAEFFRRYFDQLHLTLLKYTKKHSEAEDIIQTVFVKAWEKRHIFREMDNPMNWFFIAARNEYIDSFRKARKSRQYQQYLIEMFSELEPSSPESILTNKEYLTLYHQAIQNLPEKQQMAYLLSREKGMTYEEIAREMKVERSTAKEHIARAIKSIRLFFLSRTSQTERFIFFLLFLKFLSATLVYCSS